MKDSIMTVLSAKQLATLQVDQVSLRAFPRSLRRTITKLDQYIGKDARILIAAARSATPFTVHPEINQSLRSNQIRSHMVSPCPTRYQAVARHISIPTIVNNNYGVLPASFDLVKDPIDVYATDEAYWQSFWHRPSRGTVSEKPESEK